MKKFLWIILSFVFFSCSTWKTPYRIYKPSINTIFSPLEEALEMNEHILTVNDRFYLQVLPNNAEQIIYPPEEGRTVGIGEELVYRFYESGSSLYYGHRVLPDSSVWLPGLGKVKIAGLKISDAEDYLKNEYSRIFNTPYVKIFLLNKKAMVYIGGRDGRIVNIYDPNTTLIELITMAGGITTGKARTVYLYRNYGNGGKFYKIDLSTLDNFNYGRIVIQSNDIVYVEPRVFAVTRLLEDITPFLSLLTTSLLILGYFRR